MNENYKATGANPDLPGFIEASLENHWGGARGHSVEYTRMSKAQYAQRAHDLVLGYKAADGSIVRYDKTTEDFVKGYNTGIATMFKLKGGEERFKRLMSREGGTQDD